MDAALIFAIVQTVMTSLIGFALWLDKRAEHKGRLEQKQESGQQSNGSRISNLEDAQMAEHNLRRDMNRDIGRLDVRLSKAEVRIDEHERRLDRSDGPR